jgi:TolA-binding protein
MSNANPIRKARNDALALSEFRQYVGTYPDSELADNAEYWIGEILYAQRKCLEKLWKKYARPVGSSWRVNETFIKTSTRIHHLRASIAPKA